MNTIQLQHRTQQEDQKNNAFPLLQIILAGNLSFEVLIDELAINLNGSHKLIQVDLEFRDQKNYGQILLALFGKPIEHELFFQFLHQANIDYQIIGEGQEQNQHKKIFHQKITGGTMQLKNKRFNS